VQFHAGDEVVYGGVGMKFEVYPIEVRCPDCGRAASAYAQETRSEEGEPVSFVLEWTPIGFFTVGWGATRADLRLACSCGHKFGLP
jgi:hypothetical protein